MRLTPLAPETLDAERKPFYDSMKAEIEKNLTGFVSARSDGALVGPFNPMLAFPVYGRPAWEYLQSLTENTTLPKPAHEVAILVTGASHSSRYELYAHEGVAAKTGLSAAKIATVAAGERPADLTPEEGVAYDVAATLTKGRQLPESTYQAALAAFGEQGTAELIYLIGAYSLVSVLLNAYDVSVPGREEGLPEN